MFILFSELFFSSLTVLNKNFLLLNTPRSRIGCHNAGKMENHPHVRIAYREGNDYESLTVVGSHQYDQHVLAIPGKDYVLFIYNPTDESLLYTITIDGELVTNGDTQYVISEDSWHMIDDSVLNKQQEQVFTFPKELEQQRGAGGSIVIHFYRILQMKNIQEGVDTLGNRISSSSSSSNSTGEYASATVSYDDTPVMVSRVVYHGDKSYWDNVLSKRLVDSSIMLFCEMTNLFSRKTKDCYMKQS